MVNPSLTIRNVPYGKWFNFLYGQGYVRLASELWTFKTHSTYHYEMDEGWLVLVESVSKADFPAWVWRCRDMLAIFLVTPEVYAAGQPGLEEMIRSPEGQRLHTPLLFDRTWSCPACCLEVAPWPVTWVD